LPADVCAGGECAADTRIVEGFETIMQEKKG
jgi:hypothetical protein